MIKRQQATFLSFFSDIFRLKAERGEMGVGECKDTLSSIFEYLFEDSKKHTGPALDGSFSLRGAYENTEIFGTKVSDNVSNASENLVNYLDQITLGIKRLDVKKNKKDEEGDVATPVEDFSVACWNYFLDLETR